MYIYIIFYRIIMGNGFLSKNCKFNGCCCSNNHLIKNISKTEVITRDVSPQESMKERKTSSKNDTIQNIINYFNKEEKEIMKDLYKHHNKEKNTKNTKKKDSTKYEEMLKRLLEQQNIKLIGPKRRETIRHDDNNIKETVKQILQDNKIEAMKAINNKENEDVTLFVTPKTKKGRLSQIMDKKFLINNKINFNSYISNK